jgi:hypothetical protein
MGNSIKKKVKKMKLSRMNGESKVSKNSKCPICGVVFKKGTTYYVVFFILSNVNSILSLIPISIPV